VIRFTVYGVIAEKPRVDQLGQSFPCTLYEKLCVGSKNDCNFFDGHDELYHHAKFVEDRTIGPTCAGCRCENVVLVFLSRSESGALCVRGVHSSNKQFVAVYWPNLTRFLFFEDVDLCQKWSVELIFQGTCCPEPGLLSV